MDLATRLLASNRRYAARFHGGLLPLPGKRPGRLPTEPRLRLSIVTCMDSRIDVFGALGLRLGEAHIIRNAGAILTDDVVRSLAISQRRLGTRSVVVMAHTRCGLATFTDEEFASELRNAAGRPPAWTAGAFRDVDASVRATVSGLRASPYLVANEDISGFVYDVDTGRVRQVVAARPAVVA